MTRTSVLRFSAGAELATGIALLIAPRLVGWLLLGAPLLGVGGYMLICHGASEARAIKNTVRVGKQLADSGVNQKIVEKIAASIPGGE